MGLTAREQIHRLVDALPDDALDAVERVLAGLSDPTIAHQTALALGETPAGGRAGAAPARMAEKRLHSFFRQFEGRNLANEDGPWPSSHLHRELGGSRPEGRATAEPAWSEPARCAAGAS